MTENQQNSQSGNFKIIGGNLALMVGYTILCKLPDTGVFFDATLLFMQVLICWGLAIGYRSGVWLLAGLLVLLIGFSTCVKFLIN